LKNKVKSIPIVVLVLLTVLGSTLIFSLTPVFANPACGSTLTANTTLTGNIGPCEGNGLIIGADGITLNCAGHTISGRNHLNVGITLDGRTKVTVKNCKVTGFATGFYLIGSSSNTLTGDTSTNSIGFYLNNSSNKNTLRGNTANNNAYGFYIVGVFPGPSQNIFNRNTANKNVIYGYYDTTSTTPLSPGVPHWDTANSYTGDTGTGNGQLAAGNPNIATATSPF